GTRCRELPRPPKVIRAGARPSREPITVEAMTAMNATWRVIDNASRRSSLANSLGYQSVVKPAHTKFRREALKLKMIRTTIGANRNAYVALATAVSQRFVPRLTRTSPGEAPGW